ncbi:MAG: hydroxyacylglutathione hydrolase family protein [Candidatus Bathyarchaeota archaeon]|nr:hydroxyacylglutathione hydrolase family protein [Candidatus Bathyarchaeota archaeon]MDH5786912.1 hydroxyacylglutathione hydrolase family protein [Candidatus Bathyarchaeota archaeon]
MFFKQIKHRGDNFSYVIANENSREAVVVDPSSNADVIIRLLKDQKFNLKYIINTHGHGDHTAGNEDLRSSFSAKIVAHELARINKDISVNDGDIIELGKIAVRVIHTPGHTSDGICLLVDGKLLTGDTLFVGECGRTDLSGGNSEDMYNSLFKKLMKLDDDVEVYPGHDYGPRPYSTIGLERRTNYTLEKRTLEEFIEFMKS